MSPDDIFAAQFWPWPDPAIKRDSQGRVLFVNAAFLQLYGGTVQDWTGNVVGGWPTPQGPGQPYRFETRMPMAADMPEQVYDWMEMTLADGNAFALARNVTIFQQAAVPQPATEVPAQQPSQQNMAEQVETAQTQSYASNEIVADTLETFAEEPVYSPEPTYDAPAFDAPAFDTPVTATMEDNGQAASQAPQDPAVFAEYTPETEVMQPPAEPPQSAAPVEATPQEPPLTSAPPIVQETPPAQPPAAETPPVSQTSDRAYERRALPIEDESAVLGNNWRDAVIAKAVGADAVPAESEAAPETPMSGVTHTAMTAQTGPGPKRILLAEDNAINALLTRTLLEAEGHTVETVQDGQLAVEAMKTSTYDLVFMDMRMPNMDGLEATRKIRTLPNVPKNLPIIALTANAFDDDRNACFDSGMNDFMTKPVSAEELSEMVTQWTGAQQNRLAS